MSGNDWQDLFNGDVDSIGVDPYSLSSQTPDVRQSQPSQASTLGGLASALAGMNRGSGGSYNDLGGAGVMAGYGSNPAFGGSSAGVSGTDYLGLPDYTGG